jgi:GntR family transcriptional regulator
LVALDSLVRGLRTAVWEAGRLPRYEQLARHLAREIRQGRLAPGTPLPPETELAGLLGLSRQTVHQALAALARRGLVVRRRGVGTFVAASQLEQPLPGLYSLFKSLTAQGHVVSSRLLGFRLAPHEEASPLLAGGPFEPVYELTRLRLVDREPFAFESLYLPRELGEALPLDRVAQEPLYDLLRDCCAVTVTRAEETLQPVAVEPALAALLSVRAGDPALLVERVGYVALDRPVELRRSVIRGDRYRVRVHLEGPVQEPPDSPRREKGGLTPW